jgi:hypothetical protein
VHAGVVWIQHQPGDRGLVVDTQGAPPPLGCVAAEVDARVTGWWCEPP